MSNQNVILKPLVADPINAGINVLSLEKLRISVL